MAVDAFLPLNGKRLPNTCLVSTITSAVAARTGFEWEFEP
jgi:hypothetical protein